MHKLRGHHLICLHFFKGQGYDEKFVKNLQRILATVDVIEIVDGIDEVCKFCPHNAGFCNYSENSEKEVRELDEFALSLLRLKIGEKINWSDLKERIPKILGEWRAFACKNCDWKGVCDA
ncbi:MAG: DUF1284 domain-containing protein [Archaeoglobaceae archaeon]|uniref:DUF1284 domain-containing protein n=1 Tax=Archaeoglobus fulgidus TaxID=2234 RepID=A0A7J3M015_ARCFL